VIYAADVLGMLVSCIVKTETAAMTAMPFVLILQLVMSGIIFELEGAAAAIANITISKWGVNAICSIADVNRMPDALFLTNVSFSDYEHLTGHIARLWMLLIVFALIYGALATLSLKLFISKDKR
jgi:ABC-type multidrug transport system permease subunit